MNTTDSTLYVVNPDVSLRIGPFSLALLVQRRTSHEIADGVHKALDIAAGDV